MQLTRPDGLLVGGRAAHVRRRRRHLREELLVRNHLNVMMALALASVCVAQPLTTSGSSLAESVHLQNGAVGVTSDGNVRADGHWRSTAGDRGEMMVPTLNSVQIDCDRR